MQGNRILFFSVPKQARMLPLCHVATDSQTVRAAYAEVGKPKLSVSPPAWLVAVEILPRFARQNDIRRRIVACKVPGNLDAIALEGEESGCETGSLEEA